MRTFVRAIRRPILIGVAMMLICGLGYPLLLTGIGQLLLPHQANGSLLRADGRTVGSALIGQDFTDPRFMKCRPSAVGYNTYTQAQKESGDYAGVASGGSNYAASNPALQERVEADIRAFLLANPTVRREDIPADLVTASGSGLDPHIGPASAAMQIPALAASTGLTREQLEEIVKAHTQGKLLGVFGEATVNVLAVNLDIARALGIVGEYGE